MTELELKVRDHCHSFMLKIDWIDVGPDRHQAAEVAECDPFSDRFVEHICIAHENSGQRNGLIEWVVHRHVEIVERAAIGFAVLRLAAAHALGRD